MGFAALLRAERQRGGAGDRAGRADHGAGSPFLGFFVAAPLHVGGGIVVGSRRTGYDGTDVVSLPRSGCLLLHRWTLRSVRRQARVKQTGRLHSVWRQYGLD